MYSVFFIRWCMFHLLQCFIDSAIHSLLDSWTRWHSNFIGLLVSWLIDSPVHWFIGKLIEVRGSLIRWLIDSLFRCFIGFIDWLFIYSLIHWFTDSSIHWLIDSPIHSSIDSLLPWFIDSCFFASIIHWFTDSATPESTHSLMHWVIASLLHGFIVSLLIDSLLRCFVDLSLWFFDLLVSSLVNSVHCAWTFPYRFVSIRTFAHSVIHHLVTTSLLLHLKDLPIGHWFFKGLKTSWFFRYFRAGMVGHYLVQSCFSFMFFV